MNLPRTFTGGSITVGEFRDSLNKYPPDWPVEFREAGGNWPWPGPFVSAEGKKIIVEIVLAKKT